MSSRPPEHEIAIGRTLRAIDDAVESGARPPSLAELARSAGFSPSHLRRLFGRALGVTPREYAEERRASRLRRDLAASPTVPDAAFGAGYGGSSRVYERSAERLGMTPAAYRRGAPAERIRYAFAESSLGRLIAARTDLGVCFIAFAPPGAPDPGVADAALLADLARRFPKAALLAAPASERAWLSTVVALADDPASSPELPLDARGTAFQQRVWRALRDVPSGETISYGDLARRIGRPSAARAVAQACGANPLALAVPCHRVIGADGSLAGYRWGVERKRLLLERERRTD